MLRTRVFCTGGLGVLVCIFVLSPSLALDQEPNDACNTNVCNEKANQVVRQLNYTIPPCTDYYNYICENWRGPREDKLSVVKLKALKEIQEFFKNSSYVPGEENVRNDFIAAYESCIRRDSTLDKQALQEILSCFGITNWPLINTSGEGNYTAILMKSGLQPIFEYEVYQNKTTSEPGKIYLSAPPYIYLWGDYSEYYDYEDVPYNSEDRDKPYDDFMWAAIKLFNPRLDNNTIKEIVEGIKEVEKTLQIMASASRNDTAKKISIKDFANVTSTQGANFPLLDILNKDFGAAGVPLNENDKIILQNYAYYTSVICWLKVNSSITGKLMNYIGWTHIRDLAVAASNDLRMLRSDYDNATYITIDSPYAILNLSEECMKQLVESGLMYAAASSFYINKTFNELDKKRVQRIAKEIVSSVKNLVSGWEWMDEETKKKAMRRIVNMTIIIAYEDYYRNESFLRDLYKFVRALTPETPFVQIYFDLKKNEHFRKLRSVRREYPYLDLKEHGPLKSHAIYNEKDDVLFYPVASILTHYAGEGLPLLINYATVGGIIALVMSNAFDQDDIAVDIYVKELYPAISAILRRYELFWSNQTKDQYCKSTMMGKLEDIYCSKPRVKPGQFPVTFSDYVALRASFEAFKKAPQSSDNKLLPKLNETTLEEQFFVFFASLYCPFNIYDPKSTEEKIPYREGLDKLLRNYTNFTEAYNCTDVIVC